MSKIYGLCGYIGSGKSTIANLIEKNFDITYIDCDKLYKNILKENSALRQLNNSFWISKDKDPNNFVKEMFNKNERVLDYPLYRSATDLFRTVINPYVMNIIANARLSDKDVVIEMATMNANPIVFLVDSLISVHSMKSVEKHIEQVIFRDGRDKEVAENILYAQMNTPKLKHPNTSLIYTDNGSEYIPQNEILYTLQSIIGEATGGTLEKV